MVARYVQGTSKIHQKYIEDTSNQAGRYWEELIRVD